MTDRPLRILQVCTSDGAGGAEGSALNLFRAYRSRGHVSWLVVGYKQGDDPDVMVIPRKSRKGHSSRFCRSLRERLEPYQARMPGVWRMGKWLDTVGPRLDTWASRNPRREVERWLGIEDFNYPGTRRLLTLLSYRPDIIHCHNLHGKYFDLRVLPWLSRQAPLILNLRDAWMLSGHCSHSFDCERWKTGCGRCPDLNIFPGINRDATAYNWRRKRRIFARSRFYVTTPSEWLMRKVEQSMLVPGMKGARVIHNGVDLSVFHPADKEAARARLGIPQGARVVLSSAHGIRRNPFKDYQTMQSAIIQVAERLGGRQVVFVALGDDQCGEERIGQAEVRFVPYQNSRAAVAAYYQAADIYVHAARAEVWGLTITEALACGTPVVATAVGGIPEQIKGSAMADCGPEIANLNRYGANETTGILVPAGDAAGMAYGIERLLNDDALRGRMSENAARDAANRFGLQRQADDFLNWYQEILRSTTGDGAIAAQA